MYFEYDFKYEKHYKFELRNIPGITEQQARDKMRDETYKTQGTRFYQVLIWSEIQDLRSMIPQQIQQCINPTFRLVV